MTGPIGTSSVSRGRWWRDRGAALAIVAGGLSMSVLFIPFTVSHGPTSVNEERAVLGHDMHVWGMLLGGVPSLLIGTGLWTLRRRLSGGRPVAGVACGVISVVLWLEALMDLLLQGLGAPFSLFALVPATLVACVAARPTEAGARRARPILGLLGLVLATACGLALLPQQFSDSVGAYRAFGVLAYGVGGSLWALVGLLLVPRPDGPG